MQIPDRIGSIAVAKRKDKKDNDKRRKNIKSIRIVMRRCRCRILRLASRINHIMSMLTIIKEVKAI